MIFLSTLAARTSYESLPTVALADPPDYHCLPTFNSHILGLQFQEQISVGQEDPHLLLAFFFYLLGAKNLQRSISSRRVGSILYSGQIF